MHNLNCCQTRNPDNFRRASVTTIIGNRSMIYSRRFIYSFCTALSLLLIGDVVQGQDEKILNYDTQIEVNENRSITVTEYIEVQVASDQIKRGITRNLPTSRNLADKSVRLNYKILEVEKDGEPEPYHSEKGADLVLYLGSRDVLLDPGVYTYKIKYQVPDQIAFFEDYDEIYWNAIGNDVRFAVEQASCRVRMPAEARIVSEAAYVGNYGAQERAYTKSLEGPVVDYRTTRILQPGEAFTVAVGIEKGVFEEPNFLEKKGSLLLVILASIFLFPYFIYTWIKYGQDPPTPASYPLWGPPDELSAASINYIHKGKHDSKGFTASIVHLAIKGYLQIEEMVKKGFFSKSRKYELVKVKEPDEHLPDEETQLMRVLFQSSDRVSISGKYDRNIESTYNNHDSSLSGQHRSFIREGHNTRLLILPTLAIILVIAIAAFWLYKSPYASEDSLTFLIIFGLASIVTLVVYGYLIKKPSREKLDLRARIKGFQMYLEMAEKERLRLLNPPEMTPSHFEAILPYAFALGVEHQWTKKFESILEKAQYRPQWHNSSSPIYFSDNFGNDFSKSVSSAATKPSDKGSGSGGGGFAGGGGGGGGVGGW